MKDKYSQPLNLEDDHNSLLLKDQMKDKYRK
jgi:hypothetical protein